jgi:molybdopterin molybdotransferase
MVSIWEAREIVLAQARSFGTEAVGLSAAFGRVLAGPIRADRDYPPFPRATMDGYALRFADLQRGIRRFRITETVFAGSRALGRISGGECYKIMTGAAVPEDADIVIRREDVTEGSREDVTEGSREGVSEEMRGDLGEGVRGHLRERMREDVREGSREEISEEMRGHARANAGRDMATMEVGAKEPEPWRPQLNIARQGEDLRAGDVIIGRPCKCSPPVMGLLATLGLTTVTVAQGPEVGLVTTGNEVVEPGQAVDPVQIRNSNHWMLVGALQTEGLGLRKYSHAPDDPEHLKRLLGGFLDLDILIVTGGVSAGDADHVPHVLTALGVRPLFHKIAMRPGKPTWCGVLPGGGMVFALPGNPFSCLVNFSLLIAPYIQACQGLQPAAAMSLPLKESRKQRTPLDEFFPARVVGSPAALVQMPLNGSGDIRLGMQANALALHPAGVRELVAGSEVQFYSLV